MKTLFIIPLLIAGSVYAQSGTFLKVFGGTAQDEGYHVAQTFDGGFIIVGRTFSFGAGSSSIYLLKTNASGDTLWTKTHGSVFTDAGYSVQQTFDGGYIIAGQLGEPDTLMEGLANVYLIKTNTTGDTLWTFLWDGGTGDIAYSLQQISDSGYIACGVLNSSINFNNPVPFLIKIGANGDSLWTKLYDTSSVVNSVKQTFDGGYILTGSIGTPPTAKVYLVKTDAAGDTVWTKKDNWGFSYGWGKEVIQTQDSGFVITGSMFAGSVNNLFLSKVDKFGNLLWSKNYGGTKNDYGTSIDLCMDGGFIISGSTYSFATGQFTNSDIWLLKTNSDGDTSWTKTYGTTENEKAFSVKQCNDNGFVVTGSTGAISNVFLLKTDSLGDAPSFSGIYGIIHNSNPLFRIYPNPSNHNITIEFEIKNESNVQIIICDNAGNEVLRTNKSYYQTRKHYEHINVDTFMPGIYFIILNINGKTNTLKFQKM